MTDRFAFVVLGPPVAWQRAIPLGFGRAVKPQESRMYQRLVATVARLHLPPGWSQRGRFRMGFRFYDTHENSDVDNYVKNVKDALQGVAFKNDKLVRGYDETECFVDRERPRAEIAVRRVG